MPPRTAASTPARADGLAALAVAGTEQVPGGPMPRRTVASMTLEAMRERILHGVYPEGEPLRQDAIAEALGVSRIPIREALRQLEAEGLVTFSPHRGAVVSSLSLEDIDEVFSLRAEIEPDLLRRALPKLAPADLARAEAILDGYDRALDSADVGNWGELNWQFHSTLYSAAERPITLGIAQRLHQQADRYLRMQLALTHGQSRAVKEHRAILAAVRRHDAPRAIQLLEQHITGAGRQLVDFLRDHRAGVTAIHRTKNRT